MAITTDTGAKKIEGSDNWRDIFDDHNDTVDAYDAAIAKMDGAMAILATNNTHAAVLTGQYVYVRKHGTLTEGLYKANSDIAQNATLNSTNLSAVSKGLGGEVSALSDQIGDCPILGTLITVSVSLSTAGDFSETFTAPTAPSGYRLVGYICHCPTTRAFVRGTGNNTVFYTVVSTASSSTNLQINPVFIKS